MMRKFLLGAVILWGLMPFLHAQERVEEVLYLKNGSVIRGTVVELVPNQSVKIQTADGSLFVFEMEEVEKLTKEPLPGRRNRNRPLYVPDREEQKRAGRFSGMLQVAGFGYQELLSSYGMFFFESSYICGYRFRDFLFVGGGVGLEHAEGDFLDNTNFRIPIFVALKLNLNHKRVSPYFQLEVGKRFNSNSYFQDGIFVYPKIGIDFNLGARKRRALFLSISLFEYGNLPSFYYQSSSFYPDYYENEFYLKTGIHFGYRF
ncbi:MAG: hypothetical protein LBB90_10815 [Tannerella sp.]|jgi:hypothetical protein|nr:hypothetical protein [Tannerella sp.]